MAGISLFLRWTVVCLAVGLPHKGFGTQLETDLFEKEKEEKIGSDTTFFITPGEVKRNFRSYHRIDRSVTKMDRFTAAERSGYNFQNLGNHGTASQPILYGVPKRIGTTYGLTAYDPYFQDPEAVRYYRTHRAYAYFNIVLANLGTFLFRGCYTQRLLDNLHAGVHVRSAMTEKEWTHEKDVKIVGAFPDFDLFAHANTPDERYHAFASFTFARYKTCEMGGIRSTKRKVVFAFDEKDPVARYASARALLEEPYMENKLTTETGVYHKDVRRTVYLYHQYEWSPLVQAYHEMKQIRRKNACAFPKTSAAFLDFATFYGSEVAPLSDAPTSGSKKCQTKSRVVLKTLGNELGVKGDLAWRDGCYGLYYRLENHCLSSDGGQAHASTARDPIVLRLIGRNRSSEDPSGLQPSDENEHYVGLHTRMSPGVTEGDGLLLEGEWLLSEAAKGYHKAGIAYQSSRFTGAYHRVACKPPQLLTRGYTAYRLWNKRFDTPTVEELRATGRCGWPQLTIRPETTLQRIQKGIYWTKATRTGGVRQGNASSADHCVAVPVQAPSPIYLASYGGSLDFCFFRFFHFDHTFTWLEDFSAGPYKVFKGHVPPYAYTGRYYYAGQPYGRKMELETGASVHFKALHYADGYDVVSQQFYRQNDFAVQGRAVWDLFLNCRINNVKLFVKYSYINEDLCTPKAYFAAPFYPGQKKAADIGIHWSFFD